ncbi:MAG: hypothetical protein ACREOJ_18485 [Gemmatimonadaceae bacterium]
MLDHVFFQTTHVIYRRAVASQFTHRLGYAKGAPRPDAPANHWRQRLVESCYRVVRFCALRVKIRDEGTVSNLM